MTKDGIQEVVDRLSEVLVHVPASDPKAMADLCDWFRSLKSSPLTVGQQNIINIIEAAAWVLEIMIAENVNYGAEIFIMSRNEERYPDCSSTISNNKNRIKRMLRRALGRMDQQMESQPSIGRNSCYGDQRCPRYQTESPTGANPIRSVKLRVLPGMPDTRSVNPLNAVSWKSHLSNVFWKGEVEEDLPGQVWVADR